MNPKPSSTPTDTDRVRRLAHLVEDVARRRLGGESLSDDTVIEAHPDLMPELGDSLRALDRVEEAHCEAKSRTSAADASAGHSGTGRDGLAPPSSDSFPGFELVGETHRGGQGVVYRAIQKSTNRDVAIKVMHEGPFVGSRGKARFDREVRVLAKLKHPNIVTIHDSGTAAGSHYFVMDWITGRPLDTYMATGRGAIDETLRLFAKICEAVNAAHLRGIIHRDLKPSNILVDEAGEPHILDFGLAKTDTDELGDSTRWRSMTMTGQFVGSLPWASPEQADGTPEQIDLRTDVYSLGVLLYQMLTGGFPYTVDGAMRDVLREILEAAPARPSATRHGTDSDIDVITLKCLAKEPQCRYQSADALIEDVERYLTHQPILARSPSTVYQLKKFVYRHKLPVVFVSTFICVIVAFAVAMSFLYQRAAVARDRAVAAESLAAQRLIAMEREAETADAIKDFLVNDLLTSARPQTSRDRKVTLEEVLFNASERIEDAQIEKTEVRASIQSTLGEVYRALGVYDAAEQHFRAVAEMFGGLYGPNDERTLRANIALADALNDRGSLEEADRLSKQTLDTCLRVLTEEHEVTLAAAKARATFLWPLRRLKEASQLAYRTHLICRRLYGDGDARTLAALNVWANIGLFGAERRATIEPLLRETLAQTKNVLGYDHVETYVAMANLGKVLRDQRQLSEGESLLREAYDGLREILGEDHPTVLTVAWNFAILLREQGLVDESRRLSQKAAELSRRRLGETHPLTKNLAYYLATAFFRDGRYADAIVLLDGILQTSDLNSSYESADMARTLSAYGYALNKLGRYAEAETRIRAALNLWLKIPGGYNPGHAWCLRRLTEAFEGQNEEKQARSFAEKLLELRYEAAHHANADAYALNCYARALLTAFPHDLRDPPRALEFALLAHERSTDEYHYNRFTLARAFEANGDLEQALRFGRLALDSVPIEHGSERQEYERLVVRLLERTGSLEKAEQVYRATLAARRAHFPEGDGDIAVSLFELGSLLLEHGKLDEAQNHLLECLAIQKALLDKSDGDQHTRTLECDSAWTSTRLGQCLLEQSRYEEAEAALLEAHDRLATLTGCHTDWFVETRRLLFHLYEDWAKPTEAASFRILQSDSPIVRPSHEASSP